MNVEFQLKMIVALLRSAQNFAILIAMALEVRIQSTPNHPPKSLHAKRIKLSKAVSREQ